jgi:hypothetical protein
MRNKQESAYLIMEGITALGGTFRMREEVHGGRQVTMIYTEREVLYIKRSLICTRMSLTKIGEPELLVSSLMHMTEKEMDTLLQRINKRLKQSVSK